MNARVHAPAALVLALCALLSGCFADGPVLYPHDPPPNVPPGLTLLELSDAAIDSLRSERVVDTLGSLLLGEKMQTEAVFTAERREQILAHRVVTGMTVREVIYCFLAEPARERLQGPPGGRTLLWEPRNAMLDRYWVRFDVDGRAADAGRY